MEMDAVVHALLKQDTFALEEVMTMQICVWSSAEMELPLYQ
jgi:hypothetical protein